MNILITESQLKELRMKLIEEKQLDKLTLPKFISNSIKQHKTSLGDHPTFPPGDESSFEYKLLLKRFNEVGRAVGKINDLEQYDKNYLITKLTEYISKAKSIEINIREDLEKICYEYVCEQFNLEPGELDIECSLKDIITPDKEQNLEPLILDDTDFGEVSEMDDLGKEIYKRRIIDSLIQGASVRLSSDYSTILNKIYELNPKLPELYYNIIALNDYLTFVKEIKPETNNLGGYVSVNLSSTEPSIVSEAIIFPVLVFETIKGVMELMSSHGLPKSIRDAEYVIGKADFLLAENWDKRFGVGLYDLIINGVKNKKLIPEIFVELISLEVNEFNVRVKEIFAGTRKGKSFIDRLERQIERENDFSSIDSMLNGGNNNNNKDDEYFEAEDFNLGVDRDGYFSIDELGGIINDEAVALGNIGDIAFDMPAFGDKESLNHKDMIKNGQAKWNIRENNINSKLVDWRNGSLIYGGNIYKINFSTQSVDFDKEKQKDIIKWFPNIYKVNGSTPLNNHEFKLCYGPSPENGIFDDSKQKLLNHILTLAKENELYIVELDDRGLVINEETSNIVKKNFLREQLILKDGHPLFYHGTTDRSLNGKSGIHIGTKMAATQALQAKIGVPAVGEWDGKREYGKTLLAGKKTLERKNYIIGYDPIMNFNATEDVPDDDYYPEQRKKRAVYFSSKDLIPFDSVPTIFQVVIIGDMSNTYEDPCSDEMANEMMGCKLKQGNAKQGYYYTNIWEDFDSVSAVVPDGSFLEIV